MNFLHNLGKAFDPPPSHKRAKRGRKFTFHGSYKHKYDAIEKEKATPHSFIQQSPKGRWLVLTENK
jgi:hypothetical protein